MRDEGEWEGAAVGGGDCVFAGGEAAVGVAGVGCLVGGATLVFQEGFLEVMKCPKCNAVLSWADFVGEGNDGPGAGGVKRSESGEGKGCEGVVDKCESERLDVRKAAAPSLALRKLPSDSSLSKAEALAVERKARLREIVGERAWGDFGWEVLCGEFPEYVKFLLDRWDFCGGKDRYGRVISNAGAWLGRIAHRDGKLDVAPVARVEGTGDKRRVA